MRLAILLCTSCFLVVAACATTTLPAERVASVQGTVRAATEIGAGTHPRAALHLRLAREELAMAQQLADKGDAARAETFIERATVDATLALALVRADQARAEANQARTAVLDFQGAVQ